MVGTPGHDANERAIREHLRHRLAELVERTELHDVETAAMLERTDHVVEQLHQVTTPTARRRARQQ